MVTVTQEATPQGGDVQGAMAIPYKILGFLGDHWFAIGILVLLVTAGIIFLVLWLKKDEERKEQEDMLYKNYKDDIRACFKNQDPKMYTKKWSKWNLLWFGLPFIHVKRGGPIYDYRQNFMGYYDGSFVDMLGNTVIMAWKDKIFFIFKDHFLIRVPHQLYALRQIPVKKKKGEEDQPQKYATEIKKIALPTGIIIIPDPTHTFDKSIIIKMINMVKKGFYYYPVIMDKDEKILDLTEHVNALNHLNSSAILLENVIKESGKNVVNMAKVNTNLVYEQRKPEKVREVRQEDEENQ